MITHKDVKDVASKLNVSLSSKQVDTVLEMYADELASDPTATWDLVIENCIFIVRN
jgi:hypothetical protein